MTSKWVTGTYLGSITVSKVELKYTLELTFGRGKVNGEGVYEEKPFKVSGLALESAPFNLKATMTDAFGFNSIYLEGFRGSDDTIFGTWYEIDSEAQNKKPTPKKPQRRFNVGFHNNNEDDDDSEEEGRRMQVAKTEAPPQLQGGGRGNFFLKYKKLSPEELEARRKQEAAALAAKKEKEFAEHLASLQAMGFSKESALNALIACDGNLDRALDALTSGSVSQDAPGSTSQSSINEANVSQLVDMGFPRESVIQALEATGNNVEAAVELLFSS